MASSSSHENPVVSDPVTKELKEIILRQEERVNNLQTKAIQFVNLYFVFQGVILSSSFSASIKCEPWPILIVSLLSLLVSIFNNTAFYLTIRKILVYSEELDNTNYDYGCRSGKIQPQTRDGHQQSMEPNNAQTRCNLPQSGGNNDPAQSSMTSRSKLVKSKSKKRKILYHAGFGLMLLFDLVMLIASPVLLCCHTSSVYVRMENCQGIREMESL